MLKRTQGNDKLLLKQFFSDITWNNKSFIEENCINK